MSIAANLKTLRENAGLTLEQLAAKTGVRYQELWRYEQQKFNRVPRLDILIRLADVYLVSLDELTGRDSKKKFISNYADRRKS